MDSRTMAVLFGMLGCFWGWVAWMTSRSKQGELEKRRLELLEKSLEHPGLDEATRADLLRVLADGAGARGPTQRNRVVRTVWFGLSWLAFVIGGCMLGANALSLTPGLDSRPFLVIAITGFAMLTLPMALGELQARGHRPATTER